MHIIVKGYKANNADKNCDYQQKTFKFFCKIHWIYTPLHTYTLLELKTPIFKNYATALNPLDEPDDATDPADSPEHPPNADATDPADSPEQLLLANNDANGAWAPKPTDEIMMSLLLLISRFIYPHINKQKLNHQISVFINLFTKVNINI